MSGEEYPLACSFTTRAGAKCICNARTLCNGRQRHARFRRELCAIYSHNLARSKQIPNPERQVGYPVDDDNMFHVSFPQRRARMVSSSSPPACPSVERVRVPLDNHPHNEAKKPNTPSNKPSKPSKPSSSVTQPASQPASQQASQQSMKIYEIR